MTKKELKEYEEVCKKAWRELAETGADKKPELVDNYLHECPACEIAILAANAIKLRGDTTHQCCHFCPVNIWRKKALRYERNRNQAFCSKYGENYHNWCLAVTRKTAKHYAAKIARMGWSWLPEYKGIKAVKLD